MNCDAIIKSNDTYDIIIPTEVLERITEEPDCQMSVNDTYKLFYFSRDRVPPLSINTYTYSAIPKCFGLLDTTALEVSGIYRLQTQPTLSLRGQGVLVGFVDTGIAYENKCFRNADGSTRIRAIWDQTATPTEDDGESVLYGVEYTQEAINEALESEEPRRIVPQTDEQGHGTMLASIACGSADEAANFTGAAPYSEILAVKLKPAKSYLKEFYYIPDSALVYQENDIMAAVAYLEKKAEEYGRPLIICIGLGTNNGSHSGTSILAEYLSEVGGLWRRCIVVASGNEANARHHFFGQSNLPDSRTTGSTEGEPVSVEINVEENMKGFYLELWARAPELFAVSVRSPSGAVFPPAATRSGGHQVHKFTLENTTVEIDYRTVGRMQGDQLVFVRFDQAVRGIWTLNVYPDTTITGDFHVWLPMTGMLPSDVFFLKPDPDVTLTIPSIAAAPITVGGYQANDGSLYLNSGRGFTAASLVKPNFTAPAVGVQAVGIRGNYVTMTGTSAAAAITAGACAQIMEWGAVRRNDLSLNSVEIGNILIRGCKRSSELVYPNTSWGYGKLDAYQALVNF
jgi:subtilisin family serine protease